MSLTRHEKSPCRRVQLTVVSAHLDSGICAALAYQRAAGGLEAELITNKACVASCQLVKPHACLPYGISAIPNRQHTTLLASKSSTRCRTRLSRCRHDGFVSALLHIGGCSHVDVTPCRNRRTCRFYILEYCIVCAYSAPLAPMALIAVVAFVCSSAVQISCQAKGCTLPNSQAPGGHRTAIMTAMVFRTSPMG